MTAPPLPGVLAPLGPLLDHYGYLAVAGLVLAEDFGVPVPGETVLVAAAVYAGAGRLNIVAVGIIALAAAVTGDNIGYAIGRFGGRALVLRYGRYVFLTGERLDRAEKYFTRHGGKMITVARFLEGLRQANGIIAGISGMRWRMFLAYNALGAALWAALWSSLGYLTGRHIGVIYQQITQYSLYVLAGLGVVVLALVARHLARRRAAKKTPTATRQRPPAADESSGPTPS
jgi:membrane protein DedA with SNARE-associated domain